MATVLLLSDDRVLFDYLTVLLADRAQTVLSDGRGKLPPCDLCVVDTEYTDPPPFSDVRTVTVGFDPGADLVRPFADEALLDCLFPSEAASDPGEPCLYSGTRSVRFGGRTASLTKQEYRVFSALLAAKGGEVPKDALLPLLDGGTLDHLRVLLCHLRKKLSELGVSLHARHRGGYFITY